MTNLDITKLIVKINQTPYKELINQISGMDTKHKKWLIETIQFYKDIFESRPLVSTKSIINGLYNDLNELNKLIDNLKEFKPGG